MQLCQNSDELIATQPRHSVDRAGWQAKMASIEFWIPWRNAHGPIAQLDRSLVSKNSPDNSAKSFGDYTSMHSDIVRQVVCLMACTGRGRGGGGGAFFIMVSKIQLKPFWLAAQIYLKTTGIDVDYDSLYQEYMRTSHALLIICMDLIAFWMNLVGAVVTLLCVTVLRHRYRAKT